MKYQFLFKLCIAIWENKKVIKNKKSRLRKYFTQVAKS